MSTEDLTRRQDWPFSGRFLLSWPKVGAKWRRKENNFMHLCSRRQYHSSWDLKEESGRDLQKQGERRIHKNVYQVGRCLNLLTFVDI